MERFILNDGFDWQDFFTKLHEFRLTPYDMDKARKAGEKIEPEAFGELSDLVAQFRIMVLSAHYIHASKLYDNILIYYAYD